MTLEAAGRSGDTSRGPGIDQDDGDSDEGDTSEVRTPRG